MRKTTASVLTTLAATLIAGAPLHAEQRGHDKAGGHAMTKMPGKAAGIVVEQAWARASVTSNGAAYVSVRNTGKTTDQLIGVRTSVAKRAELHTHLMDNGIMRMRPLKAIEVTPGAPAVMRPGGDHIMLMGLTHKLKRGERFPITLRFAKAGEITVTVTVAGVGARGPAKGGDMGHGGHGGDMKHTH
ncbi:MAG: copper chaperone PCu(A)C [Alphaproteobacteria bacterium]